MKRKCLSGKYPPKEIKLPVSELQCESQLMDVRNGRSSLVTESSLWQTVPESTFALGFETFHALVFHQLL
jgi:hypothetical protein